LRVVACPACGFETVPAAKFCPECGVRLAAAAGPFEERKVVTVVFCDLVGSTARAERMDPEDVRAELSSFHARVRSDLERHGGTVEKFIGDAVVAVFGAPLVHEDDPERAVRAALAIRDWAREEHAVDVRIAVNTGEALVSVGARPEAGEGLVAGDVINTAARLQSAAPVNGVLVGEATHRATDPRIEYRPHAAVDAKGKEAPVPVWEAVSARSLLGVDVDLKPRTQLVGRRRELDLLLDALARSRAERKPQLVTVVGVPGMGKSRLVQELSVAVEADPDLVRWRQGRSLPYGQGVSYWALGEMVKAEAGILESDAAAVAESKLREAVGRVCASKDVDWLQAMLRPLIGITEDALAGNRRGEAFAAWRLFLEGLAGERPTVLVFEDLHWADDGLLDFIDAFVDWATDVPLLVVATARPELLGQRPHWGGGKPNATTLSLAPLSEHETAELVHAILERSVLAADVQAAVLSRAGGNPLYAEEFARMVADRVSGDDGRDLPVPDSLQGLISARLDALPRTEKELLQNAAVVGKVFWPGALASSDGDATALDDALRALERKEFVRRERTSAIEGELQYAFRHVLVRDVAYAQIPRAVRAEKHEHVARWIATRGRSEDAAELLAHHYMSALEYSRAAGREPGELVERTRNALREAGHRAVALNAFASAAGYFEAAAELTPEDDPEWAQVALEHAEASTYFDLSNDRLLLRARPALTDVHDAARADMVLGEYRWLRGDHDAAEQYFRAAERLAAQMTDDGARLRVVANLGRFAMLGDEHERAVALGRQALELAEQLGRDELRAHALNTIGVARSASGDVEGIADVEASRDIARTVSLPEYLRCSGNLASVLGVYGQLKRATELHREALAIASDIGYEEPTRWLSTELALDHVLAGEWLEARRTVDELMPTYERSPFWIEPQTRICRARIRVADGAVEGAVADAERAVEAARGGRSFQGICDPLAFRARLHAELGESDDAERVAHELFDEWTRTRSGYVNSWVLDLWYAAAFLAVEDRLESAMAALHAIPWLSVTSSLVGRDFAAAAAELEGMGAVYPAALVRLWGAEWLLEQGRGADAHAHAVTSLAFWRSVDAAAYARRSESLLAAAS
jgi:class 3 adenylate cyclase/tetratricopeptide (TPR) repeat protein